MKKNGFTLIELLAVIVILAIIALIATPIVLSIIDDTKQSAMLRSAEMYITGVEHSVMKENMNSGGNFRPTECSTVNGSVECDGKPAIAVEVNGEVPKDGSIIKFENGKIVEVRLVYTTATIIMDADKKLVFAEDVEDTPGTNEKTLASLCTKTSGEEKTAGALYNCEVKPGTSYNFYVLKTPAEGDTTINLIMDRNIYYDGTSGSETTSTNKGLVAWMSDSNYGCGSDGDYCAINDKGPVTAMTYLYNATKDWTNISPVNYTYNDKDVQGTTQSNTSYTSFVSTNGIATITPLTGNGVTIGTSEYPLRARMPIYSSDANITEVASSNGSNNYLYDNLDSEWYGTGDAPSNHINGIYGYWTLSSIADRSIFAWSVYYDGFVGSDDVCDDSGDGVRPVINLKI